MKVSRTLVFTLVVVLTEVNNYRSWIFVGFSVGFISTEELNLMKW